MLMSLKYVLIYPFLLLDCFSPAEIAFLFDSSGTKDDKNRKDLLEKLKKLSKELVYGFSVTETAARVAVLTYSDEVEVEMNWEQPFKTVERTVNNIKLSNRPERNLEKALRFTNENVFSLKGGLRKVGNSILHKIINAEFLPILSSHYVNTISASRPVYTCKFWCDFMSDFHPLIDVNE